MDIIITDAKGLVTNYGGGGGLQNRRGGGAHEVLPIRKGCVWGEGEAEKVLTMLKGVGVGRAQQVLGSFLCSSFLTILNVVGGGGGCKKFPLFKRGGGGGAKSLTLS